MSKLDSNVLGEKISVFIITKNEGDRIAAVIKAVKDVADEILVIDSGSTDATCEIASQLGAKVIFNEWRGYGPQKVFGEKQCRNQWILNIDADEELSPELSEEIKQLFAHRKYEKYHGYRIKIVNKFRFEEKPKPWAYYYNQLRLYNKEFAGFKDSKVHDSVILHHQDTSKINQLNAIIYHQSFRSFAHWIEKINAYSSMQAKDNLAKGKNTSVAKTFCTPVVAFLKAYIVRRYFIYGFAGFTYSTMFAFSRFVKAIKTREIFKAHATDN